MFTDVTAATYKEAIANAKEAILICSKPLCPHCKNMEKVLEKFSAKKPEVTFFELNTEENLATMEELGAERAPTIFIIKNGTIVAKKAGLMNPKELTSLYEGC